MPSKEKHPILHQFQVWGFHVCRLGTIGGMGTAIVALIIEGFTNEFDGYPAAALAGVLSLGGFWLFSRELDKCVCPRCGCQKCVC